MNNLVALKIRKGLIQWYRKHRRDLPWRQNKDPYRIWLSEVMLQQTQVDTVIPYYHRFLKRFPTVQSLAKAPLDDLLARWSGLGYYSRARSLHRAAQIVVNEKKGEWPSDLEGWMRLPGIGRYTAGAILSIAFEKRVPILDGNVMRVLCRLFALDGDPRAEPLNSRLWKLAEEILPRKNLGDFNQSLMELGAMVCTPVSPQCLLCPCRSLCKAFASGDVERFPRPKKQASTLHVQMAAAAVRMNGKFFLQKRREGEVLGGLWEFPVVEFKGRKNLESQLQKELSQKFLGPFLSSQHRGAVQHSIMNRRLKVDVYEFDWPMGRVAESNEGSQWFELKDLKKIPISSLHRKIAQVVSD
ncbi:MAG: A/G-specific adenine glycosylase [Deltaproteobacteria bacterium]|nr:A/G-specific adenine glycosylase [Deltaproteobacteria bacterium]